MNLVEIEREIEKVHINTFLLGRVIPGEVYIVNEQQVILKSKYDVCFMNGIIYFDDSENSLEERVLAALKDLKDHGNSFVWRVLPSNKNKEDLERLLIANGMKPDESSQTAYTEISKELIESFKFDMKVQFERLNESNYKDWFEVFSNAFDLPPDFSHYFQVLEKAYIDTNSPYISYVGYYDSIPVSCVSIITGESTVAGMFNIGSVKSRRGESFGMQAALYGASTLHDLGKTMIGQFATIDGIKSYSKLGAKTGNEYKNFIWTK